MDAAVGEFGKVDVLVNSVGTNLKQRALTVLDPVDWDMMLATNLSAAFNLTRAILPQLRAAGRRAYRALFLRRGAAARRFRCGIPSLETRCGWA